MTKVANYTTTELPLNIWPNPEAPKPYTRLVGPGLDFHDVYDVGERNIRAILSALEAAYHAGKADKAFEIRQPIGAEAKRR